MSVIRVAFGCSGAEYHQLCENENARGIRNEVTWYKENCKPSDYNQFNKLPLSKAGELQLKRRK